MCDSRWLIKTYKRLVEVHSFALKEISKNVKNFKWALSKFFI